MRLKLLLTSVLMASMAAACTVIILEDLEIEWSVAGYMDAAVCDDFGVDYWEVEAVGPEKRTVRYDCGAIWETESDFYDIEAGQYTVTIYALDSNLEIVGQHSGSTSTWVPADPILIDFVEADFENTTPPPPPPPEKATLTVYWNINGTQDGTDYGPSWDTCAEVGATHIAVTLDGVETSYDCSASGEMKLELEVEEGTHALKARLLDSTGQDLTTEIEETAISATTAVAGEFNANFYAISFFDGTITGDFWFSTSFEGVSYDGTNPNVYNQISLLKLDGAGLNPAPDVCGPDNQCYAADGGTFGGVYTPTDILKIKTVQWGLYTLLLQGTLDQAAGNEICWESRDCTPLDVVGGKYCSVASDGEVDILIGAGTENPELNFDLERINDQGACAAL